MEENTDNSFTDGQRQVHEIAELAIEVKNHKNYKEPTKKEKNSAQRKARFAVRIGKLTRGACVVCGGGKTHGHHQDYNKPLDVIWLCRSHHFRVHGIMGAGERPAPKPAGPRAAKSRKGRKERGEKRIERWLKVGHHEAARKLLDALSTGVITPADVDRLLDSQTLEG